MDYFILFLLGALLGGGAVLIPIELVARACARAMAHLAPGPTRPLELNTKLESVADAHATPTPLDANEGRADAGGWLTSWQHVHGLGFNDDRITGPEAANDDDLVPKPPPMKCTPCAAIRARLFRSTPGKLSSIRAARTHTH